MTDVLDSHDGDPVPGPSRPRWSLKRRLLAAAGVVGLTAAGAGAWAAYQFFGTGPQPAEALPAGTLAYVSIDLDPSGGQKIEALKTLNKFPKFKDSLGLSSTDDVRKKIFEEIQGAGGCAGLDYGSDIEPWLGDRAAIAAVDVGDPKPDVVVVVKVNDDDKANAGLTALKSCGPHVGNEVGWQVYGGWAVIAESDAIADKVVAATKKGSLADDSEFQHWTGETGDSGIVTMYAAPAAGDYLADHVDGLRGFPFSPFAVPGMVEGVGGSASCVAGHRGPCNDVITTDEGFVAPAVPDSLKNTLRDFKGAAATVRFSDGGLEVEIATESSAGSTSLLSGGGAAETVESLPADTSAAFGLSFKDGWFTQLVDQVAPSMGKTADQLIQQLSRASGLDLPADAETLAGHSAALAVGPDVKGLSGGADDSELQVAVKVTGDPDAIDKVLDKVRAQVGADSSYLGTDKAGDSVAIGPDAAYRQQVLREGRLGADPVFKDVVPDASKAGSILFLDLNRFDAQIEDIVGNDRSLLDNLEVVSGLGVAGWIDGGTTHGVLRIGTN